MSVCQLVVCGLITKKKHKDVKQPKLAQTFPGKKVTNRCADVYYLILKNPGQKISKSLRNEYHARVEIRQTDRQRS